jgi:hypothetical protein
MIKEGENGKAVKLLDLLVKRARGQNGTFGRGNLGSTLAVRHGM